MFEEAKKALLTSNSWMKCVNTQVVNRLPKENVKKHLANITPESSERYDVDYTHSFE